MKILQINSVCGYGSTGRIATDIYSILEEQGHECVIAYGRGTAPKGINSIKIGTNFDNYMHVVKTRLFDKHGFGSTSATKEFIKKAKEYNPDVFHLHNIHGYYINIELLFNYLKEANKPVVWTLHDCWAFTGHCSHFDYIGCDKWEKQCNNCPQKDRYPTSLFLDESKRNYDKKKNLFCGINNLTIITPSIWLSKLVKQSFLKEYPVKVINNGIDLKKFYPINSNNFKLKYNIMSKFIILGVANIWDERKGLKYFLELAKLIDKNSTIVMVGLTKKQINNLPNNIIGIIRTNSIEELSEIYSSADVFVNTTLEDNFPTVNIEALACGTPVITFDTGGSVESIDGDCGYIVEKENLTKLVETISKIKLNEISKEKCINRAEKFNKTEKFNKYIEIYKLVRKDSCV